MQYKIPIQIENEDTIIFDLSLRQLGIIIVGVILAFGVMPPAEVFFSDKVALSSAFIMVYSEVCSSSFFLFLVTGYTVF